MIEITVDIVPFGYEGGRDTIETVKIVNTGKKIRGKAKYLVKWEDEKGTHQFEVLHTRLEGLNILLEKCLKKYRKEG